MSAYLDTRGQLTLLYISQLAMTTIARRARIRFAIEDVHRKNLSLRKAAKLYGMSTLSVYASG